MKRNKLLLFSLIGMMAFTGPSLDADAAWESNDKGTWYSTDDGGFLTGQQSIDDKQYYFDENGWMKTGWQQAGGLWYYYNPDGTMAKGPLDLEGKSYFLDYNTGVMAIGWNNIDNQWYYFTSSGVKLFGWQKIGASWYYLDTVTGAMATDQWVGDCYVYPDGKMAANTVVNGIAVDANGHKIVNKGWIKTGNKWYYYDASGNMSFGFTNVNNKTYYLDPATGIMAAGWKQIDGTWYYFNSSGAMKTGWAKLGGKWYYLNPGSGAMATGFTVVGGKTYYLEPSGGAMATGWKLIEGNWYYFNSSGAMQTKWVRSGASWYYMDPSTGIMLKNQWIDDYYVTDSGKMAVNTTVDGYPVDKNGKKIVKKGWVRTDSKWYYYNDDSTMAKGFVNVKNKTYYLDPETGVMATGWKLIDNKWYYFNGSGAMQTGWLKTGNKWYYLNPADGVMATGFTVVGSKTYYLAPSNGVMKTGWQQIEGKWYRFNESGAMITGWTKSGSAWYYMDDSTGVMLTNQWAGDYYVNDSGKMAVNTVVDGIPLDGSGKKVVKTGWVNADNKWYYYDNNQIMKGWVTVKGKNYYLDPESGVMYTGWQVIDGKDYRFNASGAMITGWSRSGSKWYYLDSGTGVMVTDKWVGNYYLGPDGVMVTDSWVNGEYYVDANGKYTGEKKLKGWNKSGDKWYFYNDNFEMMHDTWIHPDGNWYYLKSDGAKAVNMRIGEYYVDNEGIRVCNQLVKIGSFSYLFNSVGLPMKGLQYFEGNTYYFNDLGQMQLEFQYVNGIVYYFDPALGGAMLKSTTRTFGTTTYTFDEQGRGNSEVTGNASLGMEIAKFAASYEGGKYVWGGNSLTDGVDCSGFTQQVMLHFGISIPRVADAQAWEGGGKFVSENELMPGDLIFYGTPIYHVGINMGNGQIIHSSNSNPYPQGGIKTDRYNYTGITAIVRYW